MAEISTAWVEIDFNGQEQNLVGLGFKSGFDHFESLADIVIVMAQFGNSETWDEIGTYELKFSQEKGEELKFVIPEMMPSKLSLIYENKKTEKLFIGPIHFYGHKDDKEVKK